MASPGVSGFYRRYVAFSLAAVVLLAGMLTTLLITGGIPAAHADGPVLTVSSSTTNPGGTVTVSGTGWAPAKHYNLYVYGQAKCKPNPICAPPSSAKPINSSPAPINSSGNLRGFDFKFISSAAITTYVFTVIADYPPDTPYSASVLVQVTPASTPPSGTPVSSSPTAAPATTPTTASASPTATGQSGTNPGNQTTTTPTSSSGSNTLAIVVVTVFLLIAIAVLIGLLIVLPPKRRAIRAAWYGAGNAGGTGSRRYGASGPAAPGPRRVTGGQPPLGNDDLPWAGGVAQWDEGPRSPRGSRPTSPRPPRRPPDY